MRKMFLVVTTLLTFISALIFNSLAYAGHHEKGEMTPKTVVELAVGSDATSTLVITRVDVASEPTANSTTVFGVISPFS